MRRLLWLGEPPARILAAVWMLAKVMIDAWENGALAMRLKLRRQGGDDRSDSGRVRFDGAATLDSVDRMIDPPTRQDDYPDRQKS